MGCDCAPAEKYQAHCAGPLIGQCGDLRSRSKPFIITAPTRQKKINLPGKDSKIMFLPSLFPRRASPLPSAEAKA